MLIAKIEKLETIDEQIIITARLERQSFCPDQQDFASKVLYQEALDQHWEYDDEYHRIHLGLISINQSGGD